MVDFGADIVKPLIHPPTFHYLMHGWQGLQPFEQCWTLELQQETVKSSAQESTRRMLDWGYVEKKLNRVEDIKEP